METSQRTQHYLSLFREAYGAGDYPEWFGRLRQSAIESFTRLGFPAASSEEWKYTNVEPIASVPFQHAHGEGKAVTRNIFASAFVDESCARLAFVNGFYAQSLSNAIGLPAGVRVASLHGFLGTNEAALENYLGRAARHREQP